MKLTLKRTIILMLSMFFSVQDIFAKKGNGMPTPPRGGGGFDDGGVVDGPIDNFIPVLFILAMVFGAIMITKIRSKKLIAESI